MDAGATGAVASALWLRVAEAAASEGDGASALAALGSALSKDPGSLAARALELDLLAGADPTVLAAALVTGIVLWAVDRWCPRLRRIEHLSWSSALVIGCFQAVALIPGTSRSGITLTAARSLRFDRTSAARFSFLLSIPATGLAFTADLMDLMGAEVLPVGLPLLVVGFVAAALSGFAVIAWLLRWVSRHGFLPFAIYRVALAVVILAAL